MVNQSLLNSRTKVVVGIIDTVDSGVVTLTIKDMDDSVLESGTVADYDSTTQEYYHNVSPAIFDEVETYSLTWSYKTDGNEKTVKTEMDVLEDSNRRYCYLKDMKRKLGDMLLSSSFDLSAYTLRAANELNRALQGIYVLPLSPVSTHAAYEMDEMSLRELASDIAAGYAMEDINITNNVDKQNSKKVVAFAELNRYVKLEKSFASILKNDSHADLHYQFASPRIAASRSQNGDGGSVDDPLDIVYNTFMPE